MGTVACRLCKYQHLKMNTSQGWMSVVIPIILVTWTAMVQGQQQYAGEASDAAAEGGLEVNIPGIPGEDYPIYSDVPETGFTCEGRVEGGYYADPVAECQPFHICANDGAGGLTTYSVLCPNGTIFNQNVFICDWWFNFDCSEAEGLYSINDENAAEAAAASAGAAGAAAPAYGAPGRR